MHSRIVSTHLALLAALALSCSAQEPNGKNKAAPKKELTREELAKLGGFEPAREDPIVPLIIQMEMIVFSVPKVDSLTFAADLKNSSTAEAAYRGLIGMVKKKTAKLVGNPSVETRSGNRCVIESIREVRYAIEFSPIDGNEIPKDKKPDAVQALPPQAPAAIGVTPTTFETRNIGLVLEAEPILSADGKTIDVQFLGQHVELLGWDTVSVEHKGEIIQRIPQPRFHTNKVSTNITVQIGERVLAGVFDAPGDPESSEIFLLKVGTRNPHRK